MRIIGLTLVCLISFGAIAEDTPSAQNADNPQDSISEAEAQYLAWAEKIWNSLDRQTGRIALPIANATLNVPDTFYYLSPSDADTVLTEVWGNPNGQTTLGMLFPADQTPFDPDSWGVTIEYEEDGYVSDENASDIKYQELLTSMQSDMGLANEERRKLGYETVELLGWAASPYYDAEQHKLHWAKELKFGEQEINTLNYNIRVLGRRGVLVLNFIAGMPQLDEVNDQLDTVLAIAEFDQGAQYSDFDASVDKVAAYGLGALVAGKVIAKTGIFAIVLMFLKKFGVFIVLAIGALIGRKLKRA